MYKLEGIIEKLKESLGSYNAIANRIGLSSGESVRLWITLTPDRTGYRRHPDFETLGRLCDEFNFNFAELIVAVKEQKQRAREAKKKLLTTRMLSNKIDLRGEMLEIPVLGPRDVGKAFKHGKLVIPKHQPTIRITVDMAKDNKECYIIRTEKNNHATGLPPDIEVVVSMDTPPAVGQFVTVYTKAGKLFFGWWEKQDGVNIVRSPMVSTSVNVFRDGEEEFIHRVLWISPTSAPTEYTTGRDVTEIPVPQKKVRTLKRKKR